MTDKRILCSDMTVFTRTTESDFCMTGTLKRISSAFDNGNKNVVLCGDAYSGKTFSALKFALESDMVKNIIYAEYDREKYLYNDLSIDTALKRCLITPFILQHDIRINSRFCNYLSMFEGELTSDTILIIDSFDINAPSPYMRHLFSLDCMVLVITRCDMRNIGDNAVRVDVCEEDSDFVLPDMSVLSDRQKELLMTLSSMLYYLDDDIEIKSSRSGVFDDESVKYYLGDLAEEIGALEKCMLLKRSKNNKLYMDRAVMERVFETMRPTAENCHTFMAFVQKNATFSILQNSKDISAKLYTVENSFDSFAASEEFLSVYTHFSKTDKYCGIVLYNLLVTLMLEKSAVSGGVYYKDHLLVRNMTCYINKLYECMTQETLLKRIYDDNFYGNDILPENYSLSVRANLDLIRLSVSFLRNITSDLYSLNKKLLEILYSSMTEIYDAAESMASSAYDRMMLIDDVIRLCEETFSYCEVIDEDGNYYWFRDSIQSGRIFYYGQKQSDGLEASSLAFGHSELTLKLYGIYQKFLNKWLVYAETTSFFSANRLLKEIHAQKIRERRLTVQKISACFERIRNGFGTFVDCFDDKNLNTEVYLKDIDESILKRLEDNKRLHSRGFDGGTKIGADRYSNSVIEALINSKNIISCILPVLDYNYPVSDMTYSYLLQKGVSKAVCNNKHSSNFTKQILTEALIYKYNPYTYKQSLVRLYEELIESLMISTNSSEAFEKRFKEVLCSAYVRIKLCELENVKSITNLNNNDFVTRLYKERAADKTDRTVYCDTVIAGCIYNAVCKRAVECKKETVLEALTVYSAEQIISKANGKLKGLSIVARELLGSDCEKELNERVSLMTVLSKKA